MLKFLRPAVYLAISLTFVTANPALAQVAQRLITVTGEGHVAAVPDMATLTLGVTHEAEEPRTAMKATADATAKVLQSLAELGIEPRDMQTSSLSLSPIHASRSSSSKLNNSVVGFVASNAVNIRLRKLDDLGQLLDVVIGDGANNFNGLRFSVQTPEQLIDEARKRAVGDAIAAAILLTDAAGVTLGPVQSISEHGGARPQMLEMSAARRGGAVIAAGEVSVNVSVSMIFTIED